MRSLESVFRVASKTGLLALAAVTSGACAPDRMDDSRAAAAACKELPPPRAKLCREALTHRIERIQPPHRGDARAYGQRLAAQVNRLDTHPRYLCKVREDGTIHCVSFERMIAWTDPTVLPHLVGDANALAKSLAKADDVWFRCQNGNWGSIPADNKKFRLGNWLGGASAKKMTDLCASLTNAGGAASSGTVPSGGFSGITGLDRNGPYCALGASSAKTDAEIIKQALSYAEQMKQQCGNSLLSKFMEGEDEQTEEAAPAKVVATVEIKDNGDGTETVTEKDEEGNVVETYSRDRTTTEDNLKIEYRDDGSTVFTGSNDPPATGADPSAPSPTWQQKVQKANGDYWEVKAYDDGTLTESKRSTGPDGRVNIVLNRPLECADDVCASCRSFAQFNPRLQASCRGAGGPGQLCKDFVQTSSCCGAGGSSLADPRIVTPNPQGDLVCVNPSQDFQDQRCKAQCAVASTDTDCDRSCRAAMPTDFEFTLLDQICRYAHSDDCFSNAVPLTPQTPLTPPAPEGSTCELISCPNPSGGARYLTSSALSFSLFQMAFLRPAPCRAQSSGVRLGLR